MRIRNQEGFAQLSALVDELVEASVENNGWEWLDHAVEPTRRQNMLVEARDIIREIRRTEPENAGVSARKRWIEMAFDAAVHRKRVERDRHATWDDEDDDLLD